MEKKHTRRKHPFSDILQKNTRNKIQILKILVKTPKHEKTTKKQQEKHPERQQKNTHKKTSIKSSSKIPSKKHLFLKIVTKHQQTNTETTI